MKRDFADVKEPIITTPHFYGQTCTLMLYFQPPKLLILCLPKRRTLVDNPIHIKKKTNQHVFTLDCICYILNLVEFVSFHLLNLNHSVKNHPQLQLWIETTGPKSHISNCLFDPLWANEVWILQKPVLLSNLLVSVSINSNDCMANLKIFILTCWRTLFGMEALQQFQQFSFKT